MVLSLLAAEVPQPDVRDHPEGLGPPLVVIYVAADVGSIGGGWISSALIHRGFSVNAGRKTAMLVCALCVVPIVLAVRASNLWVAVGLIGLAMAAHQGWSANLFTLVSDTFPRRAVGSVVGIGGFAGSLSGMLIATATGYLLQWTGSYVPTLIVAASAYLVAAHCHSCAHAGASTGAVAGGGVEDPGLELLTSCMPSERLHPPICGKIKLIPAFTSVHSLQEFQEFTRITGILLQLSLQVQAGPSAGRSSWTVG